MEMSIQTYISKVKATFLVPRGGAPPLGTKKSGRYSELVLKN